MTDGEKLIIACLKKEESKILSLVQKKWLDGDEVKEYVFTMEYYRTHGELPGVKTFCEKFKLSESEADSRPAFYLNAIKERYIFAVLSDKVPKELRNLKDDPRKGLSAFQEIIANLAVDAVESNDTLYSDDTDSRIQEYEERMKSLGVTYLSMGVEALDEVFYGYRKQDLITIGGKAGQGKSWLMVFLAYQLEKILKAREELGSSRPGDILFITNEMGEDEIKERLDCIRFRLPYERFLKGTLTEREKNRYYRGLSKLKEEKSFLRIVYSCQTIEELSTYMGLYRPSVVFIDGSYLMESQLAEGWEKITYITRNLKLLAKNFHIPIVNSTQLKRGSARHGSKMASDGQDDFAYSTSYTQDSDIAIRMFQDPDMLFHNLVGCEVVKGRRVKSGTSFIFQNDLDMMNLLVTLPPDDGDMAPKTVEDF